MFGKRLGNNDFVVLRKECREALEVMEFVREVKFSPRIRPEFVDDGRQTKAGVVLVEVPREERENINIALEAGPHARALDFHNDFPLSFESRCMYLRN